MSKQIYFDAMKEKGKLDAADLQTRSAGMTGTELYAEDGKIPSFAAAVVRKNMLERKVGFVCRSTAGRVVKLLQNYDSYEVGSTVGLYVRPENIQIMHKPKTQEEEAIEIDI